MKTWFFLEREPKRAQRSSKSIEEASGGIIDTAAAKRSKTSYNNNGLNLAGLKKLMGFLRFDDENRLRAGRKTNVSRSRVSSTIIL